MEAFAAGLHVMCEKPAGVYTKAVREMNEAAKESLLREALKMYIMAILQLMELDY